MSEKYQAVIDKCGTEAEKENRPEIRAIEGLLREACKGNEAACDCVLAEGKTMAGALAAMRDVASKRKGKGSCVCIAPDEAQRIIFEYYGISDDADKRVVEGADPYRNGGTVNTETAKSQTVGNADTVSLFDLI